MRAGMLRVVRGGARPGPLHIGVLIILATALIGMPAASGSPRDTAALAATGSCQFQKAAQPVQVALCDSFDQPAPPNSSRSGALNPTVWGVSQIQIGGNDQFGETGTVNDTVAPVASSSPCGGIVVPSRTVQICNGQLFESVNDDGGQTVLAMYPRQPFDIAGRTGDVTFDVSDNTQGGHGAWPTFVYTDQPVPAPYSYASGIETSARNSFGITFDQVCNQPSNQTCWVTNQVSSPQCPNSNDWTVGGMFETVGYREQDLSFSTLGCVARSTNPAQQNHVEIQISPSQVTVWASDPGSTNLVEIAQAGNLSLPLTRGLVWMEDAHYNGNKFGTQQSDTFGWDNLGFDGPVLPRDLGFDVPNSGQVNPDGTEALGWKTGGGPVTVSTLPDTQADIAAAQGALVEFTWFATDESVPSVSVNGNPAILTSWPFGNARAGGLYGPTYVWRTIAVPVPLSELKAGANSLTFQNAPGSFANVDVILQGAGGAPTCLDPSICGSAAGTPTPTPTPTPTAPPTPTPTAPPTPTATPATAPGSEPITNVPCTVIIGGRRQQGTCSGTFQPG